MSHALDNTLADGFGLDWRAFGSDKDVVDVGKNSFSRFVHAENVLFHAANALLLWLLMIVFFFKKDNLRPTSHIPVLLITAAFTLLWALHPLRVEVVAWASERKELLSVFFMLLTLIVYVFNDQYGSDVEQAEMPSDPDRAVLLKTLRFVVRNSQLILLAFFCCALLAKPVAVSLPAILFAYDWLLRRRTFRDALSRILPHAALSVFVCYMTMISQTSALAQGSEVSGITHLLCIVEAPVIYLWQTIWPFGLSADYPFPDTSSWPVFVLGCLLLSGLVALGVIAVVKRIKSAAVPRHIQGVFSTDFLAFCAVWMYIGLLPMIGVVRVGFEPHSDRYTYWIGCGAAVLGAGMAIRLLPQIYRCRRRFSFASVALLLVLSGLSIRQSLSWRDTETLFADAVEKYHGEMFAYWLSEFLEENGVEGANQAEKILRDVLKSRETPRARAALALHLAAFKADDKEAKTEARELAKSAISANEKIASQWAYAALGFADHHNGFWKSAFANMKKAYELGYESRVIKINLDNWEMDAEKESDVQR